MSLETPPGQVSPSEVAASTPHRRPSLWRQGDFMKLWTGQTISQFGDEITLLALPFVAIFTLGAGALEMGILGVVRFLPWIAFTLPAGVWVDRMRRRPILIGADIGRAAVLASIPVAFVGGWLTMAQVYVVAFLAGTLEVFFDIAYQSYLPSIVERDELVEGNSKLELSRAGSSVVGPTVAGFLVELVRAPIAIFFDALSYVGAIVFIFLIRRPETPPEAHDPATGPRPSMRQEAAEGLRYVLNHQYLRNIAACTGTLNLFGNIGQAILLLYIVEELGLTPGTIGLILTVGNVGVLAGALTSARFGRWIGVGPTIVWSAFLSSFTLVAVAIAPRDNPLPFLIAGGLIGTATAVIYNVNQVSLRQAITPDRMLGRMNATMRFIVWGTIPIGALAGGTLGELIGLQSTIWVGAIGSFIGFLPVLLSPVRGLREMPEPQPAPAS
jgi:MFS family permease